jgi:IPT/TIG domain-containing protein/NHL repeat-containing protein
MTASAQTPFKPIAPSNSKALPAASSAKANPAPASPGTPTNAIVSPRTVAPVNNNVSSSNAAGLKGTAANLNNAPFSIGGIFPAAGPRATPVTISGAHFGQNAAALAVRFNGVAAVVTGISDNQVLAIIPDKAGSGPVTITIDGKTASGGYFQYKWEGAASVWVGSGSGAGFADGSGTGARFNYPWGMAKDRQGFIYVADMANNRIRKINNFGEVSTIAGDGTPGFADGMGTAAKFHSPKGLTVDAVGNVYVVDAENNRIRRITPSGMVTTIAGSNTRGAADGALSTATFGALACITIDASGNLYVGDGDRIRKITAAGMVSTFAGKGSAGSNYFFSPRSLAVGANGEVYEADGYNVVRKIMPSGMVSILAGKYTNVGNGADGYGEAAQFFALQGICVDPSGTLYVTDYGGDYDNGPNSIQIRRITKDGDVTTVTAPGNGLMTKYWWPLGILSDGPNLYVADKNGGCIRKIVLQ